MVHLANLILAEVTYQRFLLRGGWCPTRRWVWESPATWGIASEDC